MQDHPSAASRLQKVAGKGKDRGPANQGGGSQGPCSVGLQPASVIIEDNLIGSPI